MHEKMQASRYCMHKAYPGRTVIAANDALAPCLHRQQGILVALHALEDNGQIGDGLEPGNALPVQTGVDELRDGTSGSLATLHLLPCSESGGGNRGRIFPKSNVSICAASSRTSNVGRQQEKNSDKAWHPGSQLHVR